jgi:hypothetical protein
MSMTQQQYQHRYIVSKEREYLAECWLRQYGAGVWGLAWEGQCAILDRHRDELSIVLRAVASGSSMHLVWERMGQSLSREERGRAFMWRMRILTRNSGHYFSRVCPLLHGNSFGLSRGPYFTEEERREFLSTEIL